VIAGAPIDLAAAESGLSRLASRTPISMFSELVKIGDGRLLGQMMLDLWGPPPTEEEAVRRELQIEAAEPGAPLSPHERALNARFTRWYDWTLDLPGAYYLEVVQWLYKENRLAQGTFFALGKRIDLAALTIPVLLLAGRDDQLIAPPQVLSAASLVGAPPHQIRTMIAPASHLGLFMGRHSLAQVWPEVASWLDQAEFARPGKAFAATSQ
jgi:pimeloyl-ACP methyl ester carboxylesterase